MVISYYSWLSALSKSAPPDDALQGCGSFWLEAASEVSCRSGKLSLIFIAKLVAKLICWSVLKCSGCNLFYSSVIFISSSFYIVADIDFLSIVKLCRSISLSLMVSGEMSREGAIVLNRRGADKSFSEPSCEPRDCDELSRIVLIFSLSLFRSVFFLCSFGTVSDRQSD